MTRLGHSLTARIGGVLSTVLSLCLTWWILAEGQPAAWLLGAPAIVLAAIVLSRTGSALSWRLRLRELPNFVFYFAWQSLRGGIDVARRAMSPGIAMQPAIVEYAWLLPPGSARTLATVVLNLLPGTLAVQDHGTHLSVHVLDGSEPVSLGELEGRAAALLGVELRPREQLP